MAGQILIGTSSWTDPTLIKDGNFYPPDANNAEKRLRFYASRFPLVEVDSTYYFPPSEDNSVRWLERTPKDFTFNIKAYSLLTNHPTKPDSIYKDLRDAVPEGKRFVYREDLPNEAVEEVWQRFRDALMPLHSAGKLGAILFQFPKWFPISQEVEGVHRGVRGTPARTSAWRWSSGTSRGWRSATSRRRWGSSRSGTSPTCAWTCRRGSTRASRRSARRRPTTSRWCGSTAGTPRLGSRSPRRASVRFRYDYSTDELKEWVPRISDLSSQARETHVLMNNCYRDFAVRDAQELGGLLGVDLGEED